MTKADAFKQAVEKLQSDNRYITVEQDANYMGNMDNWCMVHATKYLPIKRTNGTMYIPSTGMATGFDAPRSTVHTTLNHVVAAHGYGSWDDAPVIVMAPYNDIVKQNGNPAEVSGTDTYWSVNPDTGLVLPESAYIIQPDDNGPLFQIGEHGATYKRDNYTEDDIQKIESLLTPEDRMEYEKYKSGEIEQWDIEHEFYGDERVKQMYDSARDKQAFLRGLFEESRFAILSKYLRDFVAHLAMDKIGYRYVESVFDANQTSAEIASVAKAHNIPANASNKGHSLSVYYAMEETWTHIMAIFKGNGWNDDYGVLNASDIYKLYDFLFQKHDEKLVSAIIHNLVENKPINFDDLYNDSYKDYVDRYIDYTKGNIEYSKRDMADITNYDIPVERKNELQKEYENRIVNGTNEIAKWSAKKTIADYDKNLDETIRRHCERLSAQYNAWRNELVKQPGFPNLVQKLQTLVATQNLQHSGRDEF